MRFTWEIPFVQTADMRYIPFIINSVLSTIPTVCRVWNYLTGVSVTTDTQYSRTPIYDGLTCTLPLL